MYSYDEAISASTDYFDGDELAAKVVVDKYLLRNKDDQLLEKTPTDMHARIAREVARIEKNKFKNPLTEEQIFGLMDKFKYLNGQGSVLFGVGNNHQTVSLSNCYLLENPLDNYSSILHTDEQLVNISKRRGGCGIDLSNLRPNGAATQNAAKTATGIVSWMQRYSNSIREVGQAGRRGALMLTLDVHHPDVLDFATIKNDDTKVTGANVSLRLTQEFLTAVENGTTYEQRFPVDYKERGIKPQIARQVDARQIWNAIIHSAWLRAEPGLLMWDNVRRFTPADCYPEYQSKGTNPSLHGDTKVQTEKGWFKIRDLATKKIQFKVKTIAGKWEDATAFVSGTDKTLYRLRFVDGSQIFATEDHKHVINRKDHNNFQGWIGIYPTSELKAGDLFWTEDRKAILRLTNVDQTPYKDEVYDITVHDNTHTFLTDVCYTSNCSELNLSQLDSCRLLYLNLFSYVVSPFTKKAYFDFDLFREHAILAQRIMDDIVDLEAEKITAIIAKIEADPEPPEVKASEVDMWRKILRFNCEGRRTGTGITALGDTLAALGLKYGSEKSIEVAESIYKALKLACYESSVDMAEELAPFKAWDFEKEKNCPFIQRLKDDDPKLFNRMKKFGRRNISLTTTAPVGSGSLLTQTSSGIEPLFNIEPYIRRKKITHNDTTSRVDFTDKMGDQWQEFKVYHPKLKQWMDVTGETDIEKSPWFGACAEDIDWIQRVKLQAACQKHVCHAISSTINLPEDVSEETVAKIYETAFKSGCKGITVYRKNCRSGVLVDTKKNVIEKHDAPKRPDVLPCDVHHVSVKGKQYFVLIGLYGDSREPYEIFAGINKSIDKSCKEGKIIRRLRPRDYKAVLDDETELCPATIACSEEEEVITRAFSMSLRHGVKVEFICDQLFKVEGEMNSFAKAVGRALKKYVPDGTKSAEKCSECGSESLIYSEGCRTCQTCSSSKCN